MKKKKTKISLTVSMNRKIFEIVDSKIKNRSKYIEYLVYQDLLKNFNNDDINNILL